MFTLPALSLQEKREARIEKTTLYRKETLSLPEEEIEREEVYFPPLPKMKAKTKPPPLSLLEKPTRVPRTKRIERTRFREIIKSLPPLPSREREKQGVTLSLPPLTQEKIILPKIS